MWRPTHVLIVICVLEEILQLEVREVNPRNIVISLVSAFGEYTYFKSISCLLTDSTISTFLAALFKQLLDFRIYLFLKFFAKSINKLTRGDYVI